MDRFFKPTYSPEKKGLVENFKKILLRVYFIHSISECATPFSLLPKKGIQDNLDPSSNPCTTMNVCGLDVHIRPAWPRSPTKSRLTWQPNERWCMPSKPDFFLQARCKFANLRPCQLPLTPSSFLHFCLIKTNLWSGDNKARMSFNDVVSAEHILHYVNWYREV